MATDFLLKYYRKSWKTYIVFDTFGLQLFSGVHYIYLICINGTYWIKIK